MSNQLHGKTYEDYIKSAYPGASDNNRKNNSKWDIESKFDTLNIPTSIKTTKNKIVCLADARNFWKPKERYRLLVGGYKQIGKEKHFEIIYEFIITPEEHTKLISGASFQDVNDFHNAISVNNYPNYIEARQFAKKQKMKLSKCLVTLNPKIDSKKQRRIQCSISIDVLKENINEKYEYKNFYKGIMVCFKIESDKRILK